MVAPTGYAHRTSYSVRGFCRCGLTRTLLAKAGDTVSGAHHVSLSASSVAPTELAAPLWLAPRQSAGRISIYATGHRHFPSRSDESSPSNRNVAGGIYLQF